MATLSSACNSCGTTVEYKGISDSVDTASRHVFIGLKDTQRTHKPTNTSVANTHVYIYIYTINIACMCIYIAFIYIYICIIIYRYV